MGFLNNRIVQLLLAGCVIIAICLLVGLDLHINAGKSGFNVGVERTK